MVHPSRALGAQNKIVWILALGLVAGCEGGTDRGELPLIGPRTFGETVMQGDFNGDGINDLAVAALEEDLQHLELSDDIRHPNTIHIAYRTDNGVRYERLADIASDAEKRQSPHFGRALTAADFNGDGYADLAVGDPASLDSEATGHGEVWIYFGNSRGLSNANPVAISTQLHTDAPANFGRIMVVRDYDHDGYNDLAVLTALSLSNESEAYAHLFRGSQVGLEYVQETVVAWVLARRDENQLESPGLSRQALWSWSERSEPAIPWEEMTALQRHVAFFDFNGDGSATLLETYRGLRDLGIDPVSSSTFAVLINGGLGSATSGYPSLTVDIEHIEAGIHGSDTGIYDHEGEFVPERFFELFWYWDEDGDYALDAWELTERWREQADLFDFFGATASGAEFGLLFLLAAEDGKVSIDRMYALYDGSLFYVLAEEREQSSRLWFWPW